MHSVLFVRWNLQFVVVGAECGFVVEILLVSFVLICQMGFSIDVHNQLGVS